MSSLRKKLLIGSLFILLLIGIPAVVFLSQQQQETRSRASASTTLSFAPTSSASSPIQKGVNVPVSFDVMINPGNNLPSFVKLQITYDATKLQPTAAPFIVNDSAFPVIQEGPITSSDSILISVNVGNDYSRAIKQITKVGTVYFTTIAPTTTASTISFGAQSQVLSVSSSDESNENVLSTTSPAYVFISNPPTSTPTPTLTPTPTPIRKAGDGGNAGKGGGTCGSLGSNGSIGSASTGGTGGTGGTGCSGSGTSNAGGTGGIGGLGSSSGPGNPGQKGANGTGTGAGGGGGGGGGGAPGQPGGRGGDGGLGCNGALGQPGLPGEPAPNVNTGGKGGAGGAGGPGCTPTPTPTTTPTPTPTRIPTPTPTPVAQTPTKLNLTVFLHGIGNSGDSANPSAHSLSNKNPLNKNKIAAVEIINATNQPIATGSGTITYDTASGNFKGIIDMGLRIPSSGTYNLKVKEPTHLRSPAVLHNIVIGQTNIIPAVTLVAGDINNDYYLNILDYNILVGCYSDLAPAKSCTATNKPLADINDNGSVNQQDYNLMLREFSNQGG